MEEAHFETKLANTFTKNHRKQVGRLPQSGEHFHQLDQPPIDVEPQQKTPLGIWSQTMKFLLI